MANTYTQIHIQFVFAVKYRNGLIHSSFKDELYQYITGIIKANNHKLLAINGTSDHIHILIGMRPTQSISELMQIIIANSSKWINEKKFLNVKFEWQEGYGAFSYSKSHVQNVINYIQNQEERHKRNHFKRNIWNF
jgi:REP element-mobilizing transposase RayT